MWWKETMIVARNGGSLVASLELEKELESRDRIVVGLKKRIAASIKQHKACYMVRA